MADFLDCFFVVSASSPPMRFFVAIWKTPITDFMLLDFMWFSRLSLFFCRYVNERGFKIFKYFMLETYGNLSCKVCLEMWEDKAGVGNRVVWAWCVHGNLNLSFIYILFGLKGYFLLFIDLYFDLNYLIFLLGSIRCCLSGPYTFSMTS